MSTATIDPFGGLSCTEQPARNELEVVRKLVGDNKRTAFFVTRRILLGKIDGQTLIGLAPNGYGSFYGEVALADVSMGVEYSLIDDNVIGIPLFENAIHERLFTPHMGLNDLRTLYLRPGMPELFFTDSPTPVEELLKGVRSGDTPSNHSGLAWVKAQLGEWMPGYPLFGTHQSEADVIHELAIVRSWVSNPAATAIALMKRMGDGKYNGKRLRDSFGNSDFYGTLLSLHPRGQKPPTVDPVIDSPFFGRIAASVDFTLRADLFGDNGGLLAIRSKFGSERTATPLETLTYDVSIGATPQNDAALAWLYCQLQRWVK